MANETTDIFAISSSALKAQNHRMKVIAENVANANTTASAPGQKPYQRQVITFKKEFDKALGAYKVKVDGVRLDNSEFVKKFDPSHPAADTQGYVLQPNVNPLIETMDMSAASRSYQANLDVIAASRTMILKTIGMLQ
ncbi:MAG: flagellar basal body rod protein FlgC [Bdellovibrionales bacterium]